MWVLWLSQDFSNKAFKKTAEKCDSDWKDYIVSQDLGTKQTIIGTGSSFEILWNEKIIITSRWTKDEGMTQFHLFHPRKSKCFNKHAPNIEF